MIVTDKWLEDLIKEGEKTLEICGHDTDTEMIVCAYKELLMWRKAWTRARNKIGDNSIEEYNKGYSDAIFDCNYANANKK